MRVTSPGHRYQLSHLDDPCRGFSVLTFVKRMGDGYPGNVSRHPGTTCQEVLRALIDRVEYLDGQQRSSHNDVILDSLRTALWSFEARAAGRHGRKPPPLRDIERQPVCPQCGHVGGDSSCTPRVLTVHST